jgi:uncharacterized protein YprB with RNaseH-like and TPR domain
MSQEIRIIKMLKDQGLSFSQIGEKIGLTKDQVQKKLKAYGSDVDEGTSELYNSTEGLDKKNTRKTNKKLNRTVNSAGVLYTPGGDDYIGVNVGFFDIESTYSSWRRMLVGSIADQFGNVETYTLDTHPGKNWLDDSKLVEAYARRLEEFDVLYSWNGKLFDIPVINSRLLKNDLNPCEPQMHVDLMYKATGSALAIGRKSLENVSKYFEVNNSKTPLDVRIWDRADHGDKDAYELIIEHCEADVLVLRDVFGKLKKLVHVMHR